MILFTVKGKKREYPQVVLKGRNFYLKAQEIVAGFNEFQTFDTLEEELKDLTIEVIKIDIEPEDINKELQSYCAAAGVAGFFSPLYDKTIKKHYEPLDLEQSFDFYQNLCFNNGREKLHEIIFLVIYKNVSKEFIEVYFNLERYEVDFILDYLGVYYNYLDFKEELWLI